MESYKDCIVEREDAFFKSSPVDEYHLPQMNSEKLILGVAQEYWSTSRPDQKILLLTYIRVHGPEVISIFSPTPSYALFLPQGFLRKPTKI
jgi:hypothetical protein